MAGKIIDEDVLKLAMENIGQIIADNVYEEIPYLDSEIDNMFDGTPEDIQFYSSLISDTLVSENRIFSSKHVSDLIQQAVLDSNEYSDDLIKNISSIQLEWCETSLPATGETNKIYILPVTSGSDTVNTLNIWNSKTSAYVSIGNLEIDLSQYYTKSEIDTKLNDKANKSEVLAVNKVQTTTGSETNDTVYSSKLTKDELDKKVNVSDVVDNLTSTDTNKPLSANQGKVLKGEVDLKANDDEVVKKTDISTTIDSTSTDDTVPTSKAVCDKLKIFDRAESHNNIITNALLVDVSSPNGINNRDGIVNATSSHQIPTDLSWGYREVYWISVGNIALRITGLDINNKPSTWINTLYGNATSYNWSGWCKVTTTAVGMKS